MKLRTLFACTAPWLLTWACSSPGPSVPPEPDSGVVVDSGAAFDAGFPPDAEIQSDAGFAPDATPADVGTSTNAIWAAHWSPLPNGPTINGKQDDVYFINPSEGWSVNGLGQLHHTSDGGDHFEKLIDQPGTYFRAVLFLDAQNGFVGNIGTDYYPGVTDTRPLFVTHDGGHTLSEVTTITGPTPKGICNFSKLDDQHLFATGRVGGPAFFLKSDDGGATWVSQDVSSRMAMLIDSHFSTPLDGFLVGGTSLGSASRCTIQHTTDGGATWTEVFRSNTRGLCWKFSFPTEQIGYASILQTGGTEAFFLKTTDGGATWNELPFLPSRFQGLGVGFITPEIGWIAGDGGAYRTANGGATWERDPSLGAYVNRFRFLGDRVGYAIGTGLDKFVVE